MKWLSEVDVNAHHEKARDLRFDDTGGWLFGKPAFEDWIEMDCSSVMWLNGKSMTMVVIWWRNRIVYPQADSGEIAGSGKTILSSLVIDTLIETYKSVPTIYFYCHYGESERRQTSSIIGSLLKQISTTPSGGCEKLDPQMVSIFDDGARLNVKSSKRLFAAALSRFEKAFIVVDALDECSEEERKSVVVFLARQLISETRCHLKIFLTSRPENDLRQLLKNNPCLQIDPNEISKDITTFVTGSLTEHITNGALLDGNVTAALKEDLIQTLSEQADGMYVPY